MYAVHMTQCTYNSLAYNIQRLLLPSQCLWKCRVKLSGAFAKQRVQCGVVGLAGLLTGARKQSVALAQSLTHHARVVVRDNQPEEECMVRKNTYHLKSLKKFTTKLITLSA